MRKHEINLIPIVDDADRVVRVVTLDQFTAEPDLPVQAVIMARGSALTVLPPAAALR